MNKQPKLPLRNNHLNLKMRQAIESVLRGENINQVSNKTGIPYNTITRYYAMYQKDNEMFERVISSIEEKSLRAKRKVTEVFTPSEENALKEYFIEFENLFYGLSEKECRILFYQMAVRNAAKLPDDWKHGMASAEWLQFFKFRHPDLNIEKPDRCSTRLMRSIVWEKKNVSRFYDNLEKLVNSNPVFKSSARIYNLDETYTCMDPSKKNISKESKGDIMTTCFIVSASGTSLPPFKVIPPNTFIKPNPEAPEAVNVTAPGGRMTADLFPAVMQHFVNYSESSPQNPSILIMDIDLSHLSIAALHLAKTSGVHFLTVHPHISKQLQPLVVGLFNLFHTYYQQAIETSEDEDEVYRVYDFLKIVDEACMKSMTPDNIQNAFKKCGIVPFDRDLFSDGDYLSCMVTELPCPDCRIRDDRSRKPVVEYPVDAADENASDISSDLPGEPVESSAALANPQNSSENPKRDQTTQSEGSDENIGDSELI